MAAALELAIINQSGLTFLDLEYQRRALERQMIEHFVPAWSSDRWAAVGLDFRLEGGDVPWPYGVFTTVDQLQEGSYFPIYYRTQVPDGELGDHAPMQAQIRASSDPLDATTPSHEGLETRGDVPCDLWIPSGYPGLRLAAESADAVEDTWYPIVVDDIPGQPPRSIRVSNFVLPAWFVPGSAGPWDFCGVLHGPQQLTAGGYVIQDNNGAVSNVFGSTQARAALDAKKATPFSRAARRTSKLEAAQLGIDWQARHRAKYGRA